jgi:two-component system, OmpR family, response regulator
MEASPLDTPRILLVEDDRALRETIADLLEREGYRVGRAETADEALAVAATFRPDLAVLDVGLPGERDGFAAAERLRADSSIPILFLTAADELRDRLRGFEIGADDYLVKPFALPELLARLRAILRRAGRLRSSTIEVRDLVVDEAARTVVRGGVELSLTPLEFDILFVLARAPGTTFSKRQLLALVWGFVEFDPNLVEVHVSALRRKLDAHGPRLIETKRNAGYRLRG